MSVTWSTPGDTGTRVDPVAWAHALGVGTGEALAVEVDRWARRVQDVAEATRSLAAGVADLPEGDVTAALTRAEDQLHEAAYHLGFVVAAARDAGSVTVPTSPGGSS